MAWHPLVEGTERSRVVDRLQAIATELLAPPVIAPAGQFTLPRAALLGGLPGMVLAHAYLADALTSVEHEQRATELLEESIEHALGLEGETSLSRGLAGLAFVIEHLQPGDDGNAGVDDILRAELAAHAALPAEWSLGLAGRGVYALERRAPSLVDAIAQTIVARGERDGDGLAWRQPPDPQFTGPELIAAHPDGHFDLGILHGVTGVIAMLAAAGAAAATRDGMAWLWARRGGASPGFPAIVGEPSDDRASWSYGDPGQGATMWLAARAIGDAEWEARWWSVLIASAERTLPPPIDIGLGFGAAGVAHAFARSYHASGDARLRDAARRWITRTIEMPSPDHDGLFSGKAGVALVLAAATSEIEPAWDRLVLLSHAT